MSCDFPGCKESCAWIKEDVEAGRASTPEKAAYMVMFNQGGAAKTFCGQYHAAMFFMPPGYEVKKKKVETLPVVVVPDVSPENGQCECGHSWEKHNDLGCMFENKPYDYCVCEAKPPEKK